MRTNSCSTGVAKVIIVAVYENKTLILRITVFKVVSSIVSYKETITGRSFKKLTVFTEEIQLIVIIVRITAVFNKVIPGDSVTVCIKIISFAINGCPCVSIISRTVAISVSVFVLDPRTIFQRTISLEHIRNEYVRNLASNVTHSRFSGRRTEIMPITVNVVPAVYSTARDRIIGIAIYGHKTGSIHCSTAMADKLVIIHGGCSMTCCGNYSSCRNYGFTNRAYLSVNKTVFRTSYFFINRNEIITVFCFDYSTPVNNRLTGFAIGSASITVYETSCILIEYSKSRIMIVPRIYIVIDHGFNGNASAKEISIVYDTLHYLAVNLDNGAIACFKLAFGSNGLIRYMVNTIPSPKAYRSAYECCCIFIKLVAVSFNSKGKNLFNLVKFNSSYLEAFRGNDTLSFPGVRGLKSERYGHLVYRGDIRNVNVYRVNGTVFCLLTGIVMSAERNGSSACNGKCSGYLSSVAQRILDLKSNGMYTGFQCNIFCSSQILTGNCYIFQFNTVNIDLAGSIIKLNIVGNGSRESNAIAVDRCTVVQCYGFVLRSIAYVADRGKNSIIYSRAVIESKVIKIECKSCRSGGFYIETDKGRFTTIGTVRIISCKEITELSKIAGCVYPSGFGDICFRAGVQILDHATYRGESKVSAGTARTIGVLVALHLHSKTSSTFGDINPHTEGSCILAVCYVTKNNHVTGIEEHIVRPTCKLSSCIVKCYTKSVLAISYNSGRQEGFGVCIIGIVTVILNGSRCANLLCPIVHFVYTKEIGNIAIFKVPNNLGTFTEGNLQRIGNFSICVISSDNIDTGNIFICSSSYLSADKICCIGSGKFQRICAIHTYSPIISTISTSKFYGHALAVRKNGFVQGELKLIRIYNVNGLRTNNLTVVNCLNCNVTLLTIRGEHTVSNSTEGIVAKSEGHICGNISDKSCGVKTNYRECTLCPCSVVVILAFNVSMIKDTGCNCSGCNDNAVDRRTFCTVRRNGTHGVFRFAFTLGNEGRRTATITVNCVHTTEREHHFAHFIVGETSRGRCVTTINLTEYEGTVSLDTDHGTRSIRRSTFYSGRGQLTIFYDPTEVCRNRSNFVALQGFGHITKFAITVPVNCKVSLCAFMYLGST